MASSNESFLIIGAGVFGVSTAYHLIKRDPHASVTLVDRDPFDADSRVAASWDWNKVVRADYEDFVYCQLALEAQDVFRTDPLWMPHFHETGVYWICRNDFAKDVVENYKTLGRKADITVVPVHVARKMYDGLFDEADYTGVKEVLVNKTSGWAAAGDCLRAVTRKAMELGVRYEMAEVATVLLDDSGSCRGVQTTTGGTLTASHVILCAGAFTPKLLELSAARSGVRDLRAGPRIVAGGITTGIAQLDGESLERFASMPVGFQGYTADTGAFIGSLPPTKDGELKWWGQTIFKNTVEVLPGRLLSAPPSERDYGQGKVCERLKEDVRHASHVFFGKRGADWKLEKHRICWDAFTTSGDFIISPHPAAKGLYLATCGSFHGFKFFPVLGKYVLQMLEGSLSDELQRKWAWDRERPDPRLNPEWPRVELAELRGPSSKL
ncbi:hypothetical protein DCS_04405 [Drechmeria coniospora]|uniref:FAD dependent oxidoreductase domain-containing protein n=1 Tax=Drechmeria coniospora TaxID=98403 RepID=A0A151GJX9_DRECN|nr:hypothetical protein DCS_04405 [Drechmeria coniospora]KYK57396.1 hypothetical protein DCS_04405 [Drechmeria coniospora]ODA79294.1 hypothetical protein RJ55_04887 [Drechmeria coniospora]